MNIHVCRNQKCRATWVSNVTTSLAMATTQYCPNCIPVLFPHILSDMPIEMIVPDPERIEQRLDGLRGAARLFKGEVRRDITLARAARKVTA